MLLIKTYCLLYGVFLKQLETRTRERINILDFKQPSFIHKVDNKILLMNFGTQTLAKTMKTKNVLKKLVANVSSGLLEKGGATDQKSTVLKSLKEAIRYQTEYGGKIHKLTHFTTEQITVDEKQYTTEEEQASYCIYFI